MSVTAEERAGLADLLDKLGPDAPTLCEGWTTGDLAAHVVVRDRRPDTLPGLVLPGPAARHTESVRRSTHERTPYADLVRKVRRGPAGPFGRLGSSDLANIHEFFVHHEDVRRANGEGPRPADPRRDDQLWRRLRMMGGQLFRPVRELHLTLVAPDRDPLTLGASDGPLVTVTGPVGELFLFAFGRKDAAEVELSGDEAAVTRLREASLGV